MNIVLMAVSVAAQEEQAARESARRAAFEVGSDVSADGEDHVPGSMAGAGAFAQALEQEGAQARHVND